MDKNHKKQLSLLSFGAGFALLLIQDLQRVQIIIRVILRRALHSWPSSIPGGTGVPCAMAFRACWQDLNKSGTE